MHLDAWLYVAQFGTDEPVDVIEFGALDINGGVRDLFPFARWHGIDVVPGPGVDEVADAATWTGEPADLVICCEVFEHTAAWPAIVANAAWHCKEGGRVVFTAAGPSRAPHSAVDGGQVRPGEWYQNVPADELRMAMVAAGLGAVVVEERGGDVRGTGTR